MTLTCTCLKPHKTIINTHSLSLEWTWNEYQTHLSSLSQPSAIPSTYSTAGIAGAMQWLREQDGCHLSYRPHGTAKSTTSAIWRIVALHFANTSIDIGLHCQIWHRTQLRPNSKRLSVNSLSHVLFSKISSLCSSWKWLQQTIKSRTCHHPDGSHHAHSNYLSPV